MTDTPAQLTPAPELILKGGHVIDPANGRDGALDVGIAGGRVVAVGPDLPAPAGARVLDVAGRCVTPGIIDLHAHVCVTHPRSGLSLDPRVNTFSSGVTTVVDAGTAGWRDLADFVERVIATAKIRVLTFVNIVGAGMGGEWEHEAAEMRPALAADIARAFSDVVVGIKTAHYWARRPFDAAHRP
jgi:dihydroorotase